MTDFVISSDALDLTPVASLYREVGFRPDLVSDLSFVRDLGGVVFTATSDDMVVGASSCLPFGATGWIGGVVVHPGLRRRGLGERLTAAALHELQHRGASTILLHATPMARPLYARMGFESEEDFIELTGSSVEASPGIDTAVRPGSAADFDDVLALDREATGEDRQLLLEALWPRGGRVFDDGEIRGYSLQQLDSAAGAVIANDTTAGDALLVTALSNRAGRLRVPLPERSSRVLEMLSGTGFRETTRTTRMHHGPPVPWRAERIVSAFNLFWG